MPGEPEQTPSTHGEHPAKDVPAIRCLHIASGDLWAGAEVQLYNLATRLVRTEGIQLFVVLLNDSELAARLRDAQVHVTVLDEQRMSFPQILRAICRLAREQDIQLIHTHRLKENILGALAARWTGCLSLRTVHGRNEHPASPWAIRRRLILGLNRLIGRYLQHGVVAVSEILGDELRREFPAERVHAIPNGVDLTASRAVLFAPRPERVEDGVVEIAVVGRLAPVKRIDLVLEIAAQLQECHPDAFRFHIYGDGPLRESLEHTARETLSDGVVVFHGFQSDLVEHLHAHDALLITSDHEGLPTNLLEALSLGKPVIARAVGEIPLVLGEAFRDWCISSDDPTAFAEQLTNLRGMIRREAVPREALQARAELYDADVCARRHVTLYSRMLGRIGGESSSTGAHITDGG